MQITESIININVDDIIPNRYQPRKNFDENALEELSNSIKQYGIINPILVRKTATNYELIAGERRLRAAKKAGLKEIPVIIKEIDDKKMCELALIENLHRKDLNPMEEAKSYNDIMQLRNITQQDLATKLGKSQSAIANKIRLLTLPQEIQDAVRKNEISERHARCLLTIKDKERQQEMLERIKNEKLTVKETENIINSKEINEEEIKLAINNIIKTIETEKKGDKKMNNANFFPSFDNNVGTTNNNESINGMNPQSPTNSNPMQLPLPIAPEQPVQTLTAVQPEAPLSGASQPVLTPPIIDPPLFGVQPIMSPTTATIDPISSSLLNTPIMPVQETNDSIVQTPVIEQAVQNNPTWSVSNTPNAQSDVTKPNINISINPQPSNSVEFPTIEPQVTSTIEPTITPVIAPNVEVPIISQDSTNSNLIVPNEVVVPTTSAVEIPVSSEIVSPIQEKDKFETAKELLINNNIPFKEYKNETNKCIIIEL